MKMLASIFLVLSLLLSLAGCSNQTDILTPATIEETTESESAIELAIGNNIPYDGKGKIAIITTTLSENEEHYRSAQDMVEKYGEEKIVHILWPFSITKLASDLEIKALIINPAVTGTNAVVEKLLEVRDDIFIVYCTPQENSSVSASNADLVIMLDELKMGTSIPEQAKKLGAKTFIHYSFPRHMSQRLLLLRKDLMAEKCKEIGLEFIYVDAPDPTGDLGILGAQQFILEDVPKMVEQYGKDTAFFATNCGMQISLIKACVDTGAIYPQSCCPSPYHGFPTALGIKFQGSEDNLKYVISETTRILEEHNGIGRFSTWPVPMSMMATVASTEYAIKLLAGEILDKDNIDLKVLEQCMSDYANVVVTTSPLVERINENTVEYSNFRLVSMDFLTYGE